MRLYLFAVAAAVALAAAPMDLRAADAAPLGRRAAFTEKVKEKLGLSDEQTQKIKSELAANKESITDVVRRMHVARADLRDVIQKPGATETEIRAAAAKIAPVEADAAVLRAKLYAKVSAILTTEQNEKLKQLNASVDQFVTTIMERAGDRLNLQ